MNYYLYQGAMAFHILGLIFWIGGLIALSRMLRVFTEGGVLEKAPEVEKAVNAVWKGFVLAGLVIVLVTGLVNISSLGFAYYMKQGWFHTKLTGIIFLWIVTGLCGAQMAKLGRGETLARGKLAMINGLTSGITLIVLLVTYLGRGVS